MRLAAALLLAVAAIPASGATCVALTRADVYSIPQEAADRVYCSIKRQTLAGADEAMAVLKRDGYPSPEYYATKRAAVECLNALTTTETVYRERYDTLPDCK